jgi:hypothetical protein
MPATRKLSEADSGDRTWSTTATSIALAFAWAAIVWGLAANAYYVVEVRSQNEQIAGGYTSPRSLMAVFIVESFAELPNAAQVISYVVAERKWIPCVLVLGEIGVFAFWFVLTRWERHLATEDRRRGRR